MKFSTIAAAATALFTTSVLSKDVGCFVEGQQVAVVDLDTGVCPFTIPSGLSVIFEFTSLEEYNVEWYYTIYDGVRYRTDIRNAGRVIDIPARYLYGNDGAPLYQVHLEKELASNSTAAIRRRLMKEVPIAKRDEIDDFIASIENTDGTTVDGGDIAFEVADPVSSSTSEATLTSTASGVEIESSTETTATSSTAGASSSGASSSGASSGASVTGAPVSTVTEESSVTLTITSCSNDICVGTTVPGTLSAVTTTVSGVTTIYTTYCPLSSVETVESTKVITITSCHNNACEETTVAATPSTCETVIGGTVTEYVTYCPLSSTASEESTKVVTVVVCKSDTCYETTAKATPSTTTGTVAGETTEYVTYCPITSASGETVVTKVITSEGSVYVPETVSVTSEGSTYESTVYKTVSTYTKATTGATTEAVTTGTTLAQVSGSASASGSAVISTYAGAAAVSGASFLALAMIPLAYFF